MKFQRRCAVMGILAIVTIALYSTSRYYAPALIIHVVEKALQEKAPDDVDRNELQRRYLALFTQASTSDKMKKAMDLSHYLETTQQLSNAELDFIFKERN